MEPEGSNLADAKPTAEVLAAVEGPSQSEAGPGARIEDEVPMVTAPADAPASEAQLPDAELSAPEPEAVDATHQTQPAEPIAEEQTAPDVGAAGTPQTSQEEPPPADAAPQSEATPEPEAVAEPIAAASLEAEITEAPLPPPVAANGSAGDPPASTP